MKLSDLKIGNVVILRNGEMFTIKEDLKMGLACHWFNKNSVSFLYECCCECFDDNLKHYRNSGFDVIEVYEDITIYFDKLVKPIWVRDDLEINQGDLVWVKDYCDKIWTLQIFSRIVPSDEYKYKVRNIRTDDTFSPEVSYNEVKPAKPEDLQWFTEK